MGAVADLGQPAAILQRVAIAQRSGNKRDRPTPEAVVEAMVALEKESKKAKQTVTLPELLGQWQLTFVTGTTKTRKKAGTAIGAGRYLPGIPNIAIAYEADPEHPGTAMGRAVNRVTLGAIALTVTGPIEAIANRSVMAFDFTQWSIALGSWTAYRGSIGGGVASEAEFSQRSLRDRPFFNYFWVSNQAIAARGKGGGLALWVKV
ncbi:MAG: hypothetical protein AAGF75_10020 [Cyanobacteria bacterium P01_H01_bin.130]